MDDYICLKKGKYQGLDGVPVDKWKRLARQPNTHFMSRARKTVTGRMAG